MSDIAHDVGLKTSSRGNMQLVYGYQLAGNAGGMGGQEEGENPGFPSASIALEFRVPKTNALRHDPTQQDLGQRAFA